MKGQWFIISAVIATGIFLSISILFKQFLVIDPLTMEKMNADYYFKNVKEGMQDIVDNYDCSTGDMQEELAEFIVMSKKQLAERGCHLLALYQINDCPTKDVSFTILVRSEDMVVYTENIADPYNPFG